MNQAPQTGPQTQNGHADLPFVSILIPVRNEEGFIGRCLQALVGQDYPRELTEVMVIDGQSTDNTEYEAEHAAELLGLTVFFVPNPKGTTASGLNMGLALAHGDVIIRVDGHTRVDRSFVSASVKALQESGADAVGGPIRTRGHGVIGRAIALAMASPFGVGDAAFRHAQDERWTDTVAFGAYKREVFDRLGWFNEDVNYGEDDEFNYRLIDSGGRILLTPSISSIYFSRSDFRGLWRQYWHYGLAKAAVLERHPKRLRPRHLVPSAFVLTLAGGGLLSLINKRFAWLTALAAGLYAVANGLATLKIAKQGNKEEARYLPAVFASIHIAAGTGLIAGYVRRLRSAMHTKTPRS